MAVGFFRGDETPEELEYRRKLAELMIARGSQPREIRHWTQGVAQLADALMGGLNARAVNRREAELKQKAMQGLDLNSLFTQASSPPSAPASATPAASTEEPAPAPVFDTRRKPEAQPTLAGTFNKAQPDYLQPTLAGANPYPSPDVREKFYRAEAAKYGINPDALIAGLQAENLNDNGDLQSNARNEAGIREPSYGDFQLLIGGPGTGYGKGLGNEALAQGIDPRDPRQWREAGRFGLQQLKEKGVAPWYGFQKAGLTDESIKAPTQVASAEPMRLGPMPADNTTDPNLPWLKPGGAQPGGGADISRLIAAAQNPWLPESTRAMIMKVLESRMPGQNDWKLQDVETGTGKKSMWVNSRTQEIRGLDGGAGGGQQFAADDGSLVGEDYIKASIKNGTMTPNDAVTVRKLANYEYDPRFLAIKGNQRQRLFEHAMRLNPDLDPGNYANVFALNKEFRVGKYANSIRGSDQVIHHLGALRESFKKLNEMTPYGIGVVHEDQYDVATEWVAEKRAELLRKKGASIVNEVEANAKGVANELGKLFKGAGATSLQDIEEWAALIKPGLTKEQQDGVIKKAIELMAGGIASYRNIYDNGMGPAIVKQKPFESLFRLDKHSQEVLHDLGFTEESVGLISPGGPGIQDAAVPTPPISGTAQKAGITQAEWEQLTPEQRAHFP